MKNAIAVTRIILDALTSIGKVAVRTVEKINHLLPDYEKFETDPNQPAPVTGPPTEIVIKEPADDSPSSPETTVERENVESHRFVILNGIRCDCGALSGSYLAKKKYCPNQTRRETDEVKEKLGWVVGAGFTPKQIYETHKFDIQKGGKCMCGEGFGTTMDQMRICPRWRREEEFKNFKSHRFFVDISAAARGEVCSCGEVSSTHNSKMRWCPDWEYNVGGKKRPEQTPPRKHNFSGLHTSDPCGNGCGQVRGRLGGISPGCPGDMRKAQFTLNHDFGFHGNKNCRLCGGSWNLPLEMIGVCPKSKEPVWVGEHRFQSPGDGNAWWHCVFCGVLQGNNDSKECPGKKPEQETFGITITTKVSGHDFTGYHQFSVPTASLPSTCNYCGVEKGKSTSMCPHRREGEVVPLDEAISKVGTVATTKAEIPRSERVMAPYATNYSGSAPSRKTGGVVINDTVSKVGPVPETDKPMGDVRAHKYGPKGSAYCEVCGLSRDFNVDELNPCPGPMASPGKDPVY